MVDVPLSKLPEAGSLTGEEIAWISQLSTSITISGTTISALASDNSFNDSGSGFVSAGFAVDDYVYVEGFTGNVVNNLFSGKITALTAGKMTIGGTDGDVIVDDAAGETVTISKWVSKRRGVGAAAFEGALVTKASDQTTADYSAGAVVGWDSETYDLGGWHESVTNPSRLTVPSGVSLVSIVGEIHLNNVTAGNQAQIAIIKNGSAIDTDVGMPVQTAAPNNTTRRINIASPVLQVSPGDYFEMHLTVNADSSVTVEATSSWFAIRAV